MTRCIFCLEPTDDEPVEHIIPESLMGGDWVSCERPQDSGDASNIRFVLDRDEVCADCNHHALHDLDDYLQEKLGFVKFQLNRGRTKSGKPVRVNQKGLYATQGPEGRHVVLNASNRSVTAPDGTIVPPADDRPGMIAIKGLVQKGREVKFDFEFGVPVNKTFIRALHKIAFEALCFVTRESDTGHVLNSRYDAIREYVRYGRGHRSILMSHAPIEEGDERLHRILLHIIQVHPQETYLCDLGLMFRYLIDLAPENEYVLGLDADTIGQQGWERASDSEGIEGAFGESEDSVHG